MRFEDTGDAEKVATMVIFCLILRWKKVHDIGNPKSKMNLTRFPSWKDKGNLP